MHIKKTINIYKKELKYNNLKSFLEYFLGYSIFGNLLFLIAEFSSSLNFLYPSYLRWKSISLAVLVTIALLLRFNRVPRKYYCVLIFALQISLYVSFSMWKNNWDFNHETNFILIIPLIANVNWKLNAVSALIISIYEAIVLFHSKGFDSESLMYFISLLNSTVFISIGALIKQNHYQNILCQLEKSKISLLNLQNLMKNVLPSSIVVVRNKKVIFQNLQTRRLLRYPKFMKLEEILNKISINKLIIGSEHLNSIDPLNDENGEFRLFDYLQKNKINGSCADFDEVYGRVEDFENDAIYENVGPKTNFLDIKLAKIIWEGEESLILIMSEDHRAEKLLAEQARYKDKLLATVSHDLRTPLNGVIGLLEMVIDLITDKMIRKSLTVALRSSRLLLFMINDILDFSLISTGKLRLNPILFDLTKGVKEVAKLIKFQAKNKGLKFLFENKFSGSRDIIIRSDPNRLMQVILNLLSNALKFTQEGSIKLTVGPHENFCSMLISVEDTGMGIKKEDIPKLFRLFGKLESEESRKINANGIGLGLAISQTLVRAMNDNSGDEIQVITEYGKGSIFQFVLRDLSINSESLSIINEEQMQGCAIKSVKQFSKEILNKHDVLRSGSITISPGLFNDKESLQFSLSEKSTKNILVVDDDQINIMVFTTYLKSFADCTFDLAFNGKEAVDLIFEKAAKGNYFDMIFMDCNMPVMDGFEATRKIIDMVQMNIIPNVPIIAATANVSPSDYECCFKTGMIDFISKPFGKTLLREKIDKYSK